MRGLGNAARFADRIACSPPDGVMLRPVTELGEVTYRVLRREQGLAPEVEALARILTEATAR